MYALAPSLKIDSSHYGAVMAGSKTVVVMPTQIYMHLGPVSMDFSVMGCFPITVTKLELMTFSKIASSKILKYTGYSSISQLKSKTLEMCPGADGTEPVTVITFKLNNACAEVMSPSQKELDAIAKNQDLYKALKTKLNMAIDIDHGTDNDRIITATTIDKSSIKVFTVTLSLVSGVSSYSYKKYSVERQRLKGIDIEYANWAKERK